MPLSIPVDYRAFYKESPAALFECKPDDSWTIVKANNTFYELIGYSEETFTKTSDGSFLSLLKKESRTSLVSDFDAYMKAYSKNHQAPHMLSKLLLKRHDHSYISILVSAKIIEDGHERIACVFMPSFDEREPVIVEADKTSTDVVKEELQLNLRITDLLTLLKERLLQRLMKTVISMFIYLLTIAMMPLLRLSMTLK